ncbi:MAG: site-specific integrase [Desulfobulbaceae bacterium]|nr:site-specific integrase [Desulfobulbaceae bacterium]
MFYLKDKKKERTAIEAIISIQGKKYKYATGQSVNPEGWKDGRAKFSKAYPDGKAINLRLELIKTAINEAVEFYALGRTVPQTGEFRTKINERLQTGPGAGKKTLIAYTRQFIRDKHFSDSTCDKYITTINKLEEYEAQYGLKLYFDHIDIAFYNHFKTWFYSLINPQTGESYSKNYFGSLIKCIKRVMRYSLENGDHYNKKFNHSEFVVDNEDAETIYLTAAELMAIFNLEINTENVRKLTTDRREININKKVQSLRRVRDRFLIGAYTALRVSDFNRLSFVHIENGFLKVSTLKTQTPLIIPVHPVVSAIVERGGLDYRVSSQKINEHIKEVCLLAGIVAPVTLSRTHAGRRVETTLPKYKLVGTHTARRSAATNMYKAGIPAISIMKITGHSTEKSFMKYIKITAEENAEILAAHAYFNG